jgi:hypothetical protein
MDFLNLLSWLFGGPTPANFGGDNHGDSGLPGESG